MTTFRQIEANRRNATKSTGPVSEEGKQRSRCNARLTHRAIEKLVDLAKRDGVDRHHDRPLHACRISSNVPGGS